MGIGTLRNSPCVCGSNRKYKKCCWGKKPNEMRYNHIHIQDNINALCLTCRENAQALAVKSAMPTEEITAEL